METTQSPNVVTRVWNQYSKQLSLIALAVIALIAAWYAFQEFYQKPKEKKATEALFRAEEYYRKDSVALALNGDGQNLS